MDMVSAPSGAGSKLGKAVDMGFFDFLKKGASLAGTSGQGDPKKLRDGSPAKIDDPAKLLAMIISSVSSEDEVNFERICRNNMESIEKNFLSWKNVPEPLRASEHETQRYITAIISTAEFFQRFLGKDALMNGLAGPAESNPIKIWETYLAEARKQLSEMNFILAEKALRAGLSLSDGMEGPALKPLLSVTYGLLGQTYFHQGRAAEAFDLVLKAQTMCQEQNDLEGVLAYTTALYQITRYTGHIEEAAACCDALADVLTSIDRKGEADAWRKKALEIRKGEPLNRVQVVINGVTRELDELQGVELGDAAKTQMQFHFKRNRITPTAAEQCCRNGMLLGANGRFEDAVKEFQNASKLDPFDPEAHYKRGFTLLQLRQYNDAVTAFHATEKLAPGWFQCRSDLWLAQQLASKRYPHSVFDSLCYLADGKDELQRKIEKAQAWIDKHPDFAPFYLYLGQNLQEKNEPAAAKEAYIKAMELAEDDDLRTRVLVSLAIGLPPESEERTKYLEEAIKLNGNLLSAAMAQVLLNARQVVC